MEIKTNPKRDCELVETLLKIWRKSVFVTHDFLTREDIEKIAPYVPAAIRAVSDLLVAEIDGQPVGFAGTGSGRLEMLFIHPDFRNQGIGKEIMECLFKNDQVSEVCVNEENPQAKGFYERMGFRVYKRTPLDEQGNPFPILYMRRTARQGHEPQ